MSKYPIIRIRNRIRQRKSYQLSATEGDIDAAKKQIDTLHQRLLKTKEVYNGQRTEIQQLKGGQHAPAQSQQVRGVYPSKGSGDPPELRGADEHGVINRGQA